MSLELKVDHTVGQKTILETIKGSLTEEQRGTLYDVFTVPKTNLIRNNEEALARDNLVFHLRIAECGHTQDYDLAKVLGITPRVGDDRIRKPFDGENGNKP